MEYLCFVDFQEIRIVSLTIALGAILVSKLTGVAVVVVAIPVVGVIVV